jgi:hypothetical protein
MTTFLARYHDPALELPEVARGPDLEAIEVSRISRALAVVLIAGSIPKRLGGDASDEELALDKKRAKRTSYALTKSLRGWVGDVDLSSMVQANPAIRSEGATIDWAKFKSAHLTTLQDRLRLFATFAINEGQERWGKSMIVRLENEVNWVSYALRD